MSQEDILGATMRRYQLIEGFVKLKRDFLQYVDVQGAEPLFLDARSAVDASNVLLHVQESLSNIVRHLPEVPPACEKVRLALQDWCLAHPDQPIMTIEEFKNVVYSCKASGPAGV